MNVIQQAIAAGLARDFHDANEEYLKVSRGLESGPWYEQLESVAGAWERLCEIGLNIDNRRQAMIAVWGEDVADQIENYAYELLDTRPYPYYNERVIEDYEIRLHYGGREEGM